MTTVDLVIPIHESPATEHPLKESIHLPREAKRRGSLIPGTRKALLICSFLGDALFLGAGTDICLASGTEAAAHAIGQSLPVWTIIPFAGILLSIALCPLLTPHFWHRHFGKASAFWALLFALPFLYVYGTSPFTRSSTSSLSTISPSSFFSGGSSQYPAASC